MGMCIQAVLMLRRYTLCIYATFEGELQHLSYESNVLKAPRLVAPAHGREGGELLLGIPSWYNGNSAVN